MPKQVKRQRILRNSLLFTAIFLSFTALSPEAFAQQSQLRQQIVEPDCTAPGSCEMATPTIGTISKRSGRPIITGTFDGIHTKSLRIIFGGRIYTLGSDSELTAEGDVWRLDLSTLSPPLAAGTYELIVETIGYDGETRRVRIMVTLTRADGAPPRRPGGIIGNNDPDGNNGNNPGTDEDGATPPYEQVDRPQPIVKNDRGSLVSIISLLSLLAVSGAAYVLLAVIRRRNADDKEDVV